jgi:N-acetylglutamate synthase-like GNAT family acetyltransferase
MTDEADPKPAFTIEEVGVDVVRPVRHRHLRPNQPADAVSYQSDTCETCRHFAARDTSGAVIGVGSLNLEDRVAGQPPFNKPGMRLRGMAVEDAWRGKGVGAGLVGRMIEVGVESGIVEVWANARTANRRFYLKNGFKEVSSPFEIPGIGEHVVVALSLGKAVKKARKAARSADASGGPDHLAVDEDGN